MAMKPGDVDANGNIYQGSRINAGGWKVDEFMIEGVVMVTLTQADAAAPYGWKRTGKPRGDMVLIQRPFGVIIVNPPEPS